MFSTARLGLLVGAIALGVPFVVAPLVAQPTPPAPPARRSPVAPPAPPAPVSPLSPLAAMAPLALPELVIPEYELARVRSELARAGADLAREMNALSVGEVAALAAEGRAMAMELGAFRAPLVARGYRTEAPAPWAEQDPADSLYRDARKALSSNAYPRAAELFKQIRQKYPKSSYASDAPYWEAFALQRLGGEDNLRLAQDALGLQQRDYPRAATRGDAAALNARIEGMLARRGDEQMATTITSRARRAADDGCPRAEEDERIEALNSLSQMVPEQAMPILKKVLARREPCTQALRRTAVWMVARQKQPEAASLLVTAAKTDPDREVREQAVFWLANVPTDDAVDMLIGLAKEGDDLGLRKRAVYALSRSTSDRAQNTLRDMTLDSRVPEELRGEALMWYVNRIPQGSDRLAYLKNAYAKGQRVAFRQSVMRSVAGIRTEDARETLVNIALDSRDSLELRRSAIAHLSMGGGVASMAPRTVGNSVTGSVTVNMPAPGLNAAADAASRPTGAMIAPMLAQIYDRVEELSLRRQALASLVSLRDNAGIDKILDVAKNEKNPELRRTAVSYISRTKDPRAIALLQEIINK
ncbi:HEAT repeat domain-containing protein [Gemmatimonas sp.]|uniref:HEAT repeat domain-containing protein n=1 Tax=Gemmatimonas sp. TaxID=1962908 RepID=UPI003F6EE0DA